MSLPVSTSVLTVGVFFGGVSPEHEVSVISSLQAAAALDRSRYRPFPVYVGKDGTWYTGEHLLDPQSFSDLDALRAKARPVLVNPSAERHLELVEPQTEGLLRSDWPRHRIDVAFLGFHGGEGESGGFQGLMETLNVPYTGASVLGSAVGIDKVICKYLCRDQDIPVVDFVPLRESDWAGREEEAMDRVERVLGYPVIVKPSRLGSSIGIGKADDRAELDAAIEEALRYDDKILVEHAIEELREINCSVLGDPGSARAAVLEEPVRSKGEKLLTFQEKYMRGGGGKGGAKGRRGTKKKADGSSGMASLDRIIPAPLTPEQTERIQTLGVQVFQTFECAGVARLDFMIDERTGDIFFNEINTIPGSFSFYLWEPSGVPFDQLTHEMIQSALDRHQRKNSRVRSYDVNLLSAQSLSGIKGAKS
jgi:D-alanine-D-alanine ligase